MASTSHGKKESTTKAAMGVAHAGKGESNAPRRSQLVQDVLVQA
jgi:hypothetical protein